MPINFFELIGPGGKDEARHVFERLVIQLIRLDQPALGVAATPGDWGIDAFVGELDGRVSVWQAKFFIDGFGRAQHDQVRKSFAAALKAARAEGYTLAVWTLCIPVEPGPETALWWVGWQRRTAESTGVRIELMPGSAIESCLMSPEADDVARHYFPRSMGGVPRSAQLHPPALRPGPEELPADATVVYLCAAREDDEWRRRFEVTLRPLGRFGIFVCGKEPPSARALYPTTVDKAIGRADAALILVSPDLLSTDFVLQRNLSALAARAIPVAFVHVRAAMIEDVPALDDVAWAHDPARPLASSADPDGDIVRACKYVAGLLPHLDERPRTWTERALALRAHRSLDEQGDGRMGSLDGVPAATLEEVERDELATVRAGLLSGGSAAVGITGGSVGVYGDGGIGKTVLAAAVARDPSIRRHFPDGVLWISVGERGDIVALQMELLDRVGAARPALRSADACAQLLRRTLSDARTLLVVDDVWTVAAAAAFAVVGQHGRVLYTTRDARVLEAVGARVQRLDVLSEPAALMLLARLTRTPVDALPEAARRILEATGRVALALALVGAAVGRGGAGWAQAVDALERAGTSFLDHPYADVFKAMQFAVASLDEEHHALYLALAVYPEDTAVPLAAVVHLWTQLGATIESAGARALIETLADRELLLLQHGGFAFHDLQREFLLLRAGDMRLRHEDVLRAYRALLPKAGRWKDLEPDEPYIWTHLVYHLHGAGDARAIRELVCDLGFVAKRAFHGGPYLVESDLRHAAELYPEDAAIAWLLRLVTRWGHLLADHVTVGDLAVTLASRISDAPPELNGDALDALLPARFLACRESLPTGSPALTRVLSGRTDVRALAYAPDGRSLASADLDGGIRIWDPAGSSSCATSELPRPPVFSAIS